jgi:phospholipase/carboxylesterase
MAVDVGLRYPHKLAGLVGISGWVLRLKSCLKGLSPVALQQRLLITHGRFDPMIPFDPVREQVQKLKAAGLKAENGANFPRRTRSTARRKYPPGVCR